MASKDHNRGSQGLRGCLPPLVFTCVALWFFCFLFDHSAPRTVYKGPNSGQVQAGVWASDQQRIDNDNQGEESHLQSRRSEQGSIYETCDVARGRWVHEELRRPAYDESCRDIFKGWNCLRNKKFNAKALLAWRWQPWECDLPQMNASFFLEHFKNKRIGFVGDSLNRNMYVSLVCSLKQASQQVKKWRPVGADKALTFVDYNLTIAYHRTNLLAHYGPWKAKEDGGGPLERLGFREGFRVDVDIPQSTWAEAPGFHDVLVLNTGHWWWAPEKFDPVKSPMLFFERGEPILPVRSPEEGFNLMLKYMLVYVEKMMPVEGLRFLRTQSPRHFEGGDWKEGGTCHRQEPLLDGEVKEFFAIDGKHHSNVEMTLANLHLERAIQGTSFRLLNISYMSSFRADAHPASSGGKLHEDCMHWCLPGITDTWNDMLVLHILHHKQNAVRA